MVFQTIRFSATIKGDAKVQSLNFVLFSFSVLEILSVCKFTYANLQASKPIFRSACNLHLFTKTSWICLLCFRGLLVCNLFSLHSFVQFK